MNKKVRKTKKTTTTAKKTSTKHTNTSPALVSKGTDKQEQAISNLENLVSSIYEDLPLAQTFSGIQDEKQLAQMMAALNGTLDSLPIESLTEGLFNNPKEDAKFAKDLASVLHGLKNLSSTVNKHISDRR
ncbi:MULTISPECIES: hypothetical protein [Chlamydia]|uniref:Uncharacterized protein n=2 Tax=Chlamydia TaxID=810 RepID=A0ABP2X3I6_CHLPS|nr:MULTISPECIES: hypothetical protein [Chlamydia]AFS23224.1 hypothetical protein B600_1088 [Chlamydia psittaci VS225]AGE75531.1 hypothetical protein AO9_04900 [Chlamydia psittaci Mat116]EPJ16189.1 hypothetical protein CP02DC18_0356 [Chlamydia psittaci 02DC18]EPJ17281.1 hypothetical protein CP02DC22_0349 [Chlamydia psittaci 02DC22]EPJ19174.1 hypothetical protein CP03DC29_1164 [Chlamydia psittaci 03DC29]EPJ19620.1 hypothetical protein CP02DC23_0697 [Chlamydia psittaci 02DC23]EPJ20725.1 hypothe